MRGEENMLKKTLFVLIALALLLASCGGASMLAEPQYAMVAPDEEYGFDSAESAPPMESGLYEGGIASSGIADTTSRVSVERMVIKNADLAIIAEDPAQSMEEIGVMAEDMGGFVVESYLYQRTLDGGLQVPHATITVRVPVEKLDEALAQIKAGAVEVESANVSGQDVTSDYTDLSSRLKNLEAAEAQLQAIMDEAIRTEDVLDIFNELVRVREQIEVIKGQMKYYEESAALSKISVGITADEAVQPLQVGGWQPSGVAKDAIEALIKTLQFLVNVGIWFVLCVLPVGLLIGVPLFFVARTVIRTRKRRKAESETPEEILQEE
jgi:hypothetical protein